MSLIESLRKAQLFSDLSEHEMEKIGALCQQRTYSQGDTVLSEGETSRELFIIGQGMVEVSLKTAEASTPLIHLGTGQVFGEMTMVDRGARSATVRAVAEETVLLVIPHQDLLQLCKENNHIGFIVMRNLAAEMSLKLRYYNISGAMNANL
jgi:CRP-like cAMP-binding protein